MWSDAELAELTASTEVLIDAEYDDPQEYLLTNRSRKRKNVSKEDQSVLHQSSEHLKDTPEELTPGPSREKVAKHESKKEVEYEIKVKICRHIRQHPAIFQISHRDYGNKIVKDALWEEISKSISSEIGKHVTVAECRKYWDALRESTR